MKEQEWTPVNRAFLKCLVSNVFREVKEDVRNDKFGYFEDCDFEKILEFVKVVEDAANGSIEDFCVKNNLS